MKHHVFITGGTGYMGSRVIPLLAARGHRVTALVRDGSQSKLPAEAKAVVGDALRTDSYTEAVRGADTFVHLIAVSHPSPAKAAQFRLVDLVSAEVAVKAAVDAGVQHFIYLSVAHPAPAMRAYIAVRGECAAMIRASRLRATFVQPWYVLGPGHRWPYALLPLYWICERLPWTRDGARRLGLVTLDQMLAALISSVENPAKEIEVLDVPRIRNLTTRDSSSS
jgi:uncharacterized protein YbjT (DUF2867 family)